MCYFVKSPLPTSRVPQDGNPWPLTFYDGIFYKATVAGSTSNHGIQDYLQDILYSLIKSIRLRNHNSDNIFVTALVLQFYKCEFQCKKYCNDVSELFENIGHMKQHFK
jgi:hypothetical protein